MSAKSIFKDGLGWGLVLWFIGYVLGIVFFFVLPPSMIGWIIMPIGMAITWWVSTGKIKATDFQHYLIVAIVWTALAVLFDYLFIVMVFKPEDGYYKLDVYLYYAFTFIIPLIAGSRKKPIHTKKPE